MSNWRDLMTRDSAEPDVWPKYPKWPKPETDSNIGHIGNIGHTAPVANIQPPADPQTRANPVTGGADTPDTPDTPPDPAQERRRLAVLELLRRQPEITRACVVDGEADPVRVALAIRDFGTCELQIPRDRWDPFRFLELLDKHGGTA